MGVYVYAGCCSNFMRASDFYLKEEVGCFRKVDGDQLWSKPNTQQLTNTQT